MSSRSLPPTLARAHDWAHAQPGLRRFTLANRLLLAMAFIPTGLVKATGQRFTLLPLENPIGFFFEAMYRTGPYWYFIGAMQVVSAVLLLIPATSTVGALLFLPIVISIFLITWGVGFPGTVWITAGMVLSCVYLLSWDADRVWAGTSTLLGKRRTGGVFAQMNAIERSGWLLGGAAGVALFLTTRGFVPRSWILELLGLGVGAFVLVVVGWITAGVTSARDPRASAPEPVVD